MPLYIGIDLGTQGARALAVDSAGTVQARAERAFPAATLRAPQPGWFEQSPLAWREAVLGALGEISQALGSRRAEVAAVAACGTSGTLCLVDASGEPLGEAIMYADTRATAEAEEAAAAWQGLVDKVGYTISSSYALPRLLWVRAHEPERFARTRWALSPADLVAGWLSGVWGVSDWTNMLKTGYDTVATAWPSEAFDRLGLDLRILPRVQAPGAVIGPLQREVAEAFGLPPSALVASGATDGTAAQLASGAAAPGQWNTTIGTTLVLKGVSRRIIVDPLGRVYCHRHPDGFWLPGGASSTGADCLAQRFSAEDLAALDAAALSLSPTPLTVYPLARRGERFPFVRPDAEGFELGTARSTAERYAAHLEGIACVERLAYDTVSALGAEVGDAVYTTGGGTRGRSFTQIRADLTGRAMRLAAVPEAALGAAILAASAATGQSVTAMTEAMVHIVAEVPPRAEQRVAYEAVYERFVSACRERGYLE